MKERIFHSIPQPDYYIENGYTVFTEMFHFKRGCCYKTDAGIAPGKRKLKKRKWCLPKKVKIILMTLDEVIEKRRDTRHFLPEEVPDAVLLKALQAAHKAPSVGLSEAVKFYLVKKQPVKNAIYNSHQTNL